MDFAPPPSSRHVSSTQLNFMFEYGKWNSLQVILEWPQTSWTSWWFQGEIPTTCRKFFFVAYPLVDELTDLTKPNMVMFHGYVHGSGRSRRRMCLEDSGAGQLWPGGSTGGRWILGLFESCLSHIYLIKNEVLHRWMGFTVIRHILHIYMLMKLWYVYIYIYIL